MIKKFPILISILLLVVSFSCDKTEDADIKSSSFSGITETDSQGNLIGNIDETDWTLDDEWSEKEEAIFDVFSKNTNITKLYYFEDDIIINCAFPNPCNNYVIISFSFLPGTLLQMALVDNDFKLIDFYTADYSVGMIYIDLTELELQNNSIYRFYYRFVRPGSYTYKGHGDIKIER